VTPNTMPQDVALPETGGVSGTLSFGAYPAGATGCNGVKIATGDSAVVTSSFAPKLLVHPLASGSTKPLLTVSVGEVFESNGLFGQTSIVTGMTLNLGVVFPDGVYFMTIKKQTTDGPRIQTVKLVGMNGVLTVAPLVVDGLGMEGKNSQFPQLFIANSTAVLTLYPMGVSPPGVSDGESNTPQEKDISKAELPPPATTPPETSEASPGARGLPPPAYGVLAGHSRSVWTPGCTANPGCDNVRPVYSGGGNVTQVDGAAGMSGTVTFQLDIAYMQIRDIFIDCPSDWQVDAGFNGNGTISIPASHPFVNATCEITYSTIRPGEGSGYVFSMRLRGLDIGAH